MKIEHFTNLKNRPIFDISFGMNSKTVSAVFITLLNLKRRIINNYHESASAFGYK